LTQGQELNKWFPLTGPKPIPAYTLERLGGKPPTNFGQIKLGITAVNFSTAAPSQTVPRTPPAQAPVEEPLVKLVEKPLDVTPRDKVAQGLDEAGSRRELREEVEDDSHYRAEMEELRLNIIETGNVFNCANTKAGHKETTVDRLKYSFEKWLKTEIEPLEMRYEASIENIHV